MTLNAKTQKALDSRLVNLLKTLQRGAPFDGLEAEARKIIDLHTQNENPHVPPDQQETRLLWHGWKDHWRFEKNIAYGLFGDIERDKHARAQHEAFTFLVHVGHNEDSPLSFRKAIAGLKEGLCDYLSIRDPDFSVDLLPAAESSCVKLFGISKKPLVDGKEKDALTKAQYHVVTALISAQPEGLTKDALVAQSGHTDAVGVLKRLARKDDWKAVLPLPGKPGKHYRIA